MTDSSTFIPYAFNYQYPALLGARIKSPWVFDTDYALSQDEAAYELMERDCVFAHAFEFRRILSAGLDWYLKPAQDTPQDRKCVAILEGLLKKISNFASARVLMADAVIKGESWNGLKGKWTKQAFLGGQYRNWWHVSDVVPYDKRRFRLKTDAVQVGGQPSWSWEVERPWTSTWDPVEPTFFVHHVHRNVEKSLGRGQGCGQGAWEYYRKKAGSLRLWLQRLDRWALGMLVAKVALDDDPRARAAPDRSVRVNSWLSILEKMRAGHVAVFGVEDVVELIEASGDGSDAKLLVDYLDDAAIRYVLASLTPSGAGGSNGPGSYARAKVEQGSRESVIKLDHSELEERVGSTILNLVYRANLRAISEECRCAPSGCPEFKLKDEEEKDPVLGAQILQVLGSLQIPTKKAEAYSLVGLTPPSDEDMAAGVFFAPQPGMPGAGLSDPRLGGAPSPFAVPPGTDPQQALERTLQILRARQQAAPPAGPTAGPPGQNGQPELPESPRNRIQSLVEAAKARVVR